MKRPYRYRARGTPSIRSKPEAPTFTLCVDEAFPGLNQEDRGQPLFNPAAAVA